MSVPSCEKCVDREKIERSSWTPLDAWDVGAMHVLLVVALICGLALPFALPHARTIGIGGIVFFAGTAFAIIGRRVVRWLKFAIVGEYFYDFDDVTGQSHCHRTSPEISDFYHCNHGRITKTEIPQLFCRIRNGGIFCKNQYFQLKYGKMILLHSGWKIRSWRAAADLRLVDEDGGGIPVARINKVLQHVVLGEGIINYLAQRSVGAIYRKLEYERAELQRVQEQLSRAGTHCNRLDTERDAFSNKVKQRDDLLFRLAMFLGGMYDSVKKPMTRRGQSPYGQAMREGIEQLCSELTDEQVEGVQSLIDLRRKIAEEEQHRLAAKGAGAVRG